MARRRESDLASLARVASARTSGVEHTRGVATTSMLALVCSDSCHSLMSRYPLPTFTTNEVTVRVIYVCVYVCIACVCHFVLGTRPAA